MKSRIVCAHVLLALACLGAVAGLPAIPANHDSRGPGPLRDHSNRVTSHLDNPGEATRWRNLSLQDEHGQIAPDALMRARRQVDEMRAAQPPAASDAGITPTGWTSIGPGNVGGRVRAIVIHPANPQTLFAAGVSGGIWKSSNGGGTWSPVDDFMANLAVVSLVMTPGAPAVMYAATGEGFTNHDAIRGAGVFKSTDTGTTWVQLAATSSAPSAGLAAEDFHYMTRLAISPDGSTLLATSSKGIFRSTNGGTTFARATMADASTMPVGEGVVDVDFDPQNSSRAIASTYQGAVLYSSDGGATWALASGLPTSSGRKRAEIAYAPSNPNIVYAALDVSNGWLYKSTDAGRTFAALTTSATWTNIYNGQGWYNNLLWVSPTDPDLILWGGVDIFRSVNGGLTFAFVGNASIPHVDFHIAVAAPDYNGTTNAVVYVGSDGGVFKTTNVAAGTTAGVQASWTSLNNNFGVTQFFGAAGHPGSGRIVGGTQDNGSPLYDPTRANASNAWGNAFPDWDGGYAAYDPGDADVFYGTTQYLQIFRGRGTGVATFIAAGSTGQKNGLDDSYTDADFIAPILLDPSDSNTLFGGGASLWRTRNARAAPPAFERIKTSDMEGGGKHHVTAIAAGRAGNSGRSNVLWIGASITNGVVTTHVYRTDSGAGDDPVPIQGTWRRVGAGVLPDRRVLRITLQPDNPNVAYVCFGGFSPGNVWKTADGGQSWSDVTGSGTAALPDVPVRGFAIHPTNANWLYAATEVGLFTSEDGGATWRLPHDGPANVSVEEVFFLNTTLYAVTHGRGIFRTLVAISPTRPTISPIDAVSVLAGRSATAAFTVADPDTPAATLTLTATSSNTAVIPASAIVFGGSGGNRTVTVTPPAGVTGTSLITVTVSDGRETAATAFTATAVDGTPVISTIRDVTFAEGTTNWTESFTISDPDTALSALTVSAVSANTAFVPAPTLGGSGASRTITFGAVAKQFGKVPITVSVSDGAHTATRTFFVSVAVGPTAPTLSGLRDRSLARNTTGASSSFTVGDPDTPLDNLTLAARSTNPALVPTESITFGGSGGTRTIAYAIGAGQSGSSIVSVSVSDGTNTTSSTFTVTVAGAASAAPTITGLSSQSVASGSSVTVNFTVGDSDTPLTNLALSGATSDSTIVPVSGIVFGGALAARTVTVTPTTGRTGTVIITVAVSDGVNRTMASFVVTVTSVPSGVGTPSNLAVEAVVGNAVTLTWTQGAGTLPPTGYLLEGGVTPGAAIGTLAINTTATTFTATLPTGVFYLRLYAVSGVTRSAASNEIKAYVNVPAPPSAPANLLGLVNGQTLGLAWRNTSTGGVATSLVLDVSGAITLSMPLPVNETFAFSGVPPGRYTLALRAVNDAGVSAASNAVTLTFPGACTGAPESPSSLTVTRNGSALTVAWQLPPSGAAPSGYTLLVGGAMSVAIPTSARSLSGSVAPGTYTLAVVASNACGTSAATTPQTISVP